VAVSIAVMRATKTLHPPGGATALIAVISSPQVTNLGYLYAMMPVGGGALVMLAVALLVNNLAPRGVTPNSGGEVSVQRSAVSYQQKQELVKSGRCEG
jgi:CBS-domain-containing membrane protein